MTIAPNSDGDWINQRRADFESFMPIGDKDGVGIFSTVSRGLETARDSWIYNYSSAKVDRHTSAMISVYEAERRSLEKDPEHGVTSDASKISWSRSLRANLQRGKPLTWNGAALVDATYRPFSKVSAYFDRSLNNVVGQLPRMFPTRDHKNVGFYALNPGAEKPFSVLATDLLPDLALYGSNAGHYFPRWTWEYTGSAPGSLDFGEPEDEGVVAGFRRVDNITDVSLTAFRAAYPDASVSKDDIFAYIYGLLHSPDFRSTYAADLKRMLPRVPFASDFNAFVDAGRLLARLHVGYESVEPFALEEAVTGDASSTGLYRVQKMTFGKGPRVDGRATADRSTIVYNSHVTLSGIPEHAYRYMLGSRSAIEWIMERYQVKTDKASGIVNDPNDWATEHDQPRYILDLLKRIVTVSVRTNEIVDSLPPLEILPPAD